MPRASAESFKTPIFTHPVEQEGVTISREDLGVLLDMLKFDITNYKKQYSADVECAAYDRLSAALSKENG